MHHLIKYELYTTSNGYYSVVTTIRKYHWENPDAIDKSTLQLKFSTLHFHRQKYDADQYCNADLNPTPKVLLYLVEVGNALRIYKFNSNYKKRGVIWRKKIIISGNKEVRSNLSEKIVKSYILIASCFSASI